MKHATFLGMAKRRSSRRRSGRRRGRRKAGIEEQVFIGIGAVVLIWLFTQVAADQIEPLVQLFILLMYAIALVGVLLAGSWLLRYLWKQHRAALAHQKRHAYYAERRSLQRYMQMDPIAFEHHVAELYRKQGYQAEVTPGRIDAGIDIILTRRGTEERIAVQVKRYASKNHVQRQEVQSFYGSYVDEGFGHGVMVTTSRFSERALLFAKDKNLDLVEGAELMHMFHQLDTI